MSKRICKQWRTSELKIIHDNFDRLSYAQLTELLPGRAKHSVKTKCHKLGLTKTTPRQDGDTWTANGYLNIQVNGRARLLHHYAWEHHHGPIPDGHRVYWIDGNRLNCDITNLAMATREELFEIIRQKRSDNANHKLGQKVRGQRHQMKKKGITAADMLMRGYHPTETKYGTLWQ